MVQPRTLRTALCTVLLALALVGTVLEGVVIHDGLQAVTDPTTTFAWWTRLPGGRALWLSKRPACSPAVVPTACRLQGLTTDPRVSVMYYPPASGRVEHTIRLPQR